MKYPSPRVEPTAEKFLGIPFKRGGRDLAGADCLGVAFLFLHAMGIPLPDPWSETLTVAWARGDFREAPNPEKVFEAAGVGEWFQVDSTMARAGDFVVRLDGMHVAAHVGGGMVITAARHGSSCLRRADRYGESTVWRWRQ